LSIFCEGEKLKKIFEKIIESPQMLEGKAWERKHYHINDIVVKEGELGNSLFFIEKGELRVTGRVDLGGNKHIQPGMGDLKVGIVFGESCLHESLPRIATVTAITEAHVLEIKAEELKQYLDSNSELGYAFYKALFEVLIGRLNRSNHTVESLMAWGLKVHELDRYL